MAILYGSRSETLEKYSSRDVSLDVGDLEVLSLEVGAVSLTDRKDRLKTQSKLIHLFGNKVTEHIILMPMSWTYDQGRLFRSFELLNA